ncbi:MAG: phosphoribosyltransferase family protein [Prevotellaceae bacterium]|jgi:hypothetical protein|nr:phosphoribosyltransferase family protein [Prevotellaceae bacterium]
MTLNQNSNREIIRFSAHQIDSPDRFDFSPEEYSIFKYGSANIARKFGYELADSFIKNCFSHRYDGQPVAILSSAYSHIPTASFYMKNFFADKLNGFLFRNNFPVAEEIKIHRTVTYREDYGEMSADERYSLIKGDKFYVDKNRVGNKLLIFLDDIRITGTHERIIVKMLDDYGIFNPCFMLFFAELADSRIHPKIENTLNNAFVKKPSDLECIIRSGQFSFNTRTVKFILNSSHDEFDSFVAKRDSSFISALYYNAIGNEYYRFPSYSRNLMRLMELCDMPADNAEAPPGFL